MQCEALVQIQTQVRRQRHALLRQPYVIADVPRLLDKLLETLNEQIAEVKREIAMAPRQDADWAAAAERFADDYWIGMLTASWALVTTLKFALCPTPEASVSHTGLTPYVCASGSSVLGQAQIGQAGNHHLLRALYLASFSAMRYNPMIKTSTTACELPASQQRWRAVRPHESSCTSPERW